MASVLIGILECELTEQCFEFDVACHKVVKPHVSIFIAVSHDDGIERCVADTKSWEDGRERINHAGERQKAWPYSQK